MDKEAFEEIIAGFPAEFQSLKGLTEELHRTLVSDTRQITLHGRSGTSPMIDAFSRAVAKRTEGEM
jgi:hypothetical protein